MLRDTSGLGNLVLVREVREGREVSDLYFVNVWQVRLILLLALHMRRVCGLM